MMVEITEPVALTYWRLGLVTGVTGIGEMVAWVDGEIGRAENTAVSEAYITLSLSGRLPHSQILQQMNQFTARFTPNYELSVSLLLGRAGLALTQKVLTPTELYWGLRLLREEERLPRHFQDELYGLALAQELAEFEMGEGLDTAVVNLLTHYASYQPIVQTHLGAPH
jgi:hypothetical protein